ncbi:lysoplasmalogenase family protein [Tenacibaculum soleae]|uniref:lysoplasmalogenase family protein n=1 Tax=Tenacibaculum soleae TaxID=447689 RepID=UPI0026E2B9D4|nr:lysoplasmalogenase family protein [Tenacibaculum soleae]MDO6744119.1 lysoplasmalogenase family protein [Tenacibaculum soleae]
MNHLSSFKIYSVIYFITCIVSLLFIDNNESIIEMILKILTIVLTCFLYLAYTTKINYWYLLLLMFCIVADALLIFDQDFLKGGILLLMFTRVIYLIILRKTILTIKLKVILPYVIPGCFAFFIMSYLLYSFVENMLLSIFMICLLNLIVIGVSFYQYLYNMTKDNLYFMLGIFLITIADFIIAFNKFLDYQLYYVVLYTVMYYVARYLICIAMIKEKR